MLAPFSDYLLDDEADDDVEPFELTAEIAAAALVADMDSWRRR